MSNCQFFPVLSMYLLNADNKQVPYLWYLPPKCFLIMDYNIITLQQSFHCNTVLSKFSEERRPHPELSCSWHWSVKLTMFLPFSKQLALWWGFIHRSSHFTARMRVLLFLCVSIFYQARMASLSLSAGFCWLLLHPLECQDTAATANGLNFPGSAPQSSYGARMMEGREWPSMPVSQFLRFHFVQK